MSNICPKHGVEKVWRVNAAKESGGQYICLTCARGYKENWYAKNRKGVIENANISQKLNREAHNKANRTYQKTVKGKLTKVVSAANRRSKLSGHITRKNIQTQYELQEGKCFYCSDLLTRYHVDHVIPVVRGGSNTPDNIVISCPTCNLKKGSQLPCEWLNYPC